MLSFQRKKMTRTLLFCRDIGALICNDGMNSLYISSSGTDVEYNTNSVFFILSKSTFYAFFSKIKKTSKLMHICLDKFIDFLGQVSTWCHFPNGQIVDNASMKEHSVERE